MLKKIEKVSTQGSIGQHFERWGVFLYRFKCQYTDKLIKKIWPYPDPKKDDADTYPNRRLDLCKEEGYIPWTNTKKLEERQNIISFRGEIFS